MRIGYNTHATSPNFDKNKLYIHLQKIRPPWMLVMDGLQVARDIKSLLPECNVIHRAWPDSEIWHQLSPADWVAQKKREIGDADVWCYTVNEQALPDALCDWFTQVIELAAMVNLKVVVGNCSVGTPAPEQWRTPAALKLLRALDKHRTTAALGLHEYYLIVPTSGVLGGYPDNAGVAPNSGQKGRNLVESWPTANEMKTLTCFHMGRFKFMVAACNDNAIRPPRTVITEWGADDVSDIKAWADQQPKTPPYIDLRGWKTLTNVWHKFFPLVTAQFEYATQLLWADKAIYMGTCIEGQLVFSWGHSSIDWDMFDVSQALEFQANLEIAVTTPNTQPPTNTPPDTTPPANSPPDANLTAIRDRLIVLSNQLQQHLTNGAVMEANLQTDIEILNNLINKV